MAKAILKYTDSNDNAGTKNFPNVNEDYVPIYGSSTSVANAYKVKQAVTALNALTTNTIISIGLQVDYDITSVTSDDTVQNVTVMQEVNDNG